MSAVDEPGGTPGASPTLTPANKNRTPDDKKMKEKNEGKECRKNNDIMTYKRIYCLFGKTNGRM